MPRPESRREELVKAERLFAQKSPDWPALRDRLVADPETRPWVVRMLIHYALESYRKEGVSGDDSIEALVVAAAGHETYFARCLQEFKILDGVAVDQVHDDLLQSRLGENRQVGVFLMGAIGEPAVGKLGTAARGGATPHLRKAAVQGLGQMTKTPAAVAVLRELLLDPDWQVRAVAAESLGAAGDDQSLDQIARLSRTDADAFVRGMAMRGLARAGNARGATLLIDRLAEATAARAVEDAKAARESLHRLAGRDYGLRIDEWRRWLAQWHPESRSASQ